MQQQPQEYPDLPDLAKLGIELDDDDLPPQHDPNRGRRDQLNAADLVASIQRRTTHGDSPLAARLHDNAFAPDTSASIDPESSADVLRFFGRRGDSSTERMSANVKALQALQHRSRHPPNQPPTGAPIGVASPPALAANVSGPTVAGVPGLPGTHGASEVVKGAAFDPTLYGSLPPDIGSLDCTVYVQYLPVTMREVEFMDLICAHGEPKRVRICGNPKKEHNWTYGFVEYGSPEEAARFIANCDGVRAGPFRMRCNIAKTPIVDRLAIDAPPDGKCTFAQKFPNRTLRELILASISVSEDPPQAIGTPHAQTVFGTLAGTGPLSTPTAESSRTPLATVAGVQSPLSIPTDFAIPIIAAIKDAVNFAMDRNQSSFYSAKQSITVVLEHARRRNETVPPARYLATLLNGTDVVFLCRLLLTVLHVMHGSCDEALNHALSALQSLPTSIDIVNYINKLDPEMEALGCPRGFTPLLLNHLVAFGLVLEPASVLAARAFYQVAHHRGNLHGLVMNKALDNVVASDLVPMSYVVSPSPDGAPQQTSLLRALFPMLASQENGFANFFTSYLAKTGNLSSSGVAVFAYPAGAEGQGAAGLGSPLHSLDSHFGASQSISRGNAPW
jgi:hypothetical protein